MWMLPVGAAAEDEEVEGSAEVVAESLPSWLAASFPSRFTSVRLELGVDELVSFAAEEEAAIVISEAED